MWHRLFSFVLLTSPIEPPQLPPTLTLKGENFTGDHHDNNVTVIEGQVYDVTCNVSGGFPEVSVSNISVECAGIPVINQSFIFTREMSFDKCVCRADHLSGCYNLYAAVDINVLCKDLKKCHFLLSNADQTVHIPLLIISTIQYVSCSVIMNIWWRSTLDLMKTS